ncbi:MAG: antibiotic biosynthesis monooxygenase [Desulforhopalus sp.]
MIITTIRLHGLPQKRKEIIQTVRGLADQMAKDDGCNYADFYQDLHDKNVFYLMEEWKTASDLENHKKSKSYAVLFGLEALLVESLEIKHAVKCKLEKKDAKERVVQE